MPVSLHKRNYCILWGTIVLLLFSSLTGIAKTRKEQRKYDMTEQDLVAQVIECLRSKSSSAYTALFPESDSIAYWLLQVVPPNSQQYLTLSYQLMNPEIGMQKDSVVDALNKKNFDSIIHRGEQMYINWNAILLTRYELVKLRRIKDSVYESLSPERFKGFFFVRDMLTRKTYGIAVNDIIKIGDQWYGGTIHSVYRAGSVDEYLQKQSVEYERISNGQNGNFGEDSTQIAVMDDDQVPIRQQVVDRKLFTGTFDNEIHVELYIRYIRGGCPEGICSWEGTFQFGNQEPVKADITRTKDGKWQIEEETGVMTLTLNGNTYSGSWTSSSDGTEYEVKLEDAPVSNRRLRALDDILDD